MFVSNVNIYIYICMYWKMWIKRVENCQKGKRQNDKNNKEVGERREEMVDTRE